MKLYLVREEGTTAVHGIFWAKNLADLWDAVDEMGDPSDFEWAKIRSASGVWRSGALDPKLSLPERSAFPDTDDGEEAYDEAFNKALAFGFTEFGDSLWQMIAHPEEHEWTRFDYADEGVGVVVRIFDQVHGRE